MRVTHAFVSTNTNTQDSSFVRKEEWNDDHVIEGNIGASIAGLILDYTEASDFSNVSVSAATWTDYGSGNQTFTKQHADSLLEIVVRTIGQATDTSGSDDIIALRGVIDSAGTPVYGYFHSQIESQNLYHGLVGGSFFVEGLAAGSHTVKTQVWVSGGGNYYMRPSSAPEGLWIQVIEHLSTPLQVLASDLVTSTTQYTSPTSGTDWADVDTDDIVIVLTTGARRVLMGFTGLFMEQDDLDSIVMFDFTIDGTRVSGTNNGFAGVRHGNFFGDNVGMTYLSDALTAGEHTFRVQWRNETSGRRIRNYGAVSFWVHEMPDSAITGSSDAPWLISITPEMLRSAEVGTWALYDWSGEGINYGNGNQGLDHSPGNQDDSLAWPVVLSAGTWTVHLRYRKSSNVGIFTVKLDGSSVGTVDGYAASPALGSTSITDIAVATSGKKTLEIVIATKNASSSGYFAGLTGITLLRTA
jgi:hypothetical protein